MQLPPPLFREESETGKLNPFATENNAYSYEYALFYIHIREYALLPFILSLKLVNFLFNQ